MNGHKMAKLTSVNVLHSDAAECYPRLYYIYVLNDQPISCVEPTPLSWCYSNI